jgi:small subunit ribosomal protein S16
MAVKIRLQRMGGKRKPFYRFVVMDSRNRRDGSYLDSLGHYNPIAKPHEIEIDEEKVFKWLGQGAQLSEGARSILSKIGVLKKWEEQKGGPPAAAPEDTSEEVAESQES